MAVPLTLSDAKNDLRVTHDFDDASIQAYIEAASDEVLRYLNRDNFDDFGENIPASITMGIKLLVRCFYDENDAGNFDKYRDAVINIVMPYRLHLGI